MEHIVLGLLMLKSMTIYELNQAFGHGLSLIYSASYGHLQYAVKKLLSNDMITFEELVENGRNKKIYHINQKGIDEFFSWMASDADTKQIETQMLSKVFFLGLVKNNEDKKSIVDSLLKSALDYQKELLKIKQETDNVVLPDEYKDIGMYQFKTLSYGVGTFDFAIKWLKQIQKEIN